MVRIRTVSDQFSFYLIFRCSPAQPIHVVQYAESLGLLNVWEVSIGAGKGYIHKQVNYIWIYILCTNFYNTYIHTKCIFYFIVYY